MFNKKNEKEKTFKIGDCVIRVEKVEKEFVILQLTGKEYKFQTMVKITNNVAREISRFISEAETVNNLPKKMEFTVQARHRDYVDNADGNGFMYHYYKSNAAKLTCMSVGGHCIISLLGDDQNHHSYRTTSFVAYDVIPTMRALGLYVGYLAGEKMMHNW